MGANLIKLPKLYKYIASKLKQSVREMKKQAGQSEVEVKFNSTFIEKMKKAKELYQNLWLSYKEKYL